MQKRGEDSIARSARAGSGTLVLKPVASPLSALARVKAAEPPQLDLSQRQPEPNATEISGFVVWFTGLPGAGKTTIANSLTPELERHGFVVDHLDGDAVRAHLSSELGFSRRDRDANVARIAWISSRLVRAGAVVIVSAVSPYEEARQAARASVEPFGDFIEVHVSTPLDECIHRDPKGLYAEALAGVRPGFTGVSAPYEVPRAPELRIDTVHRTVQETTDEVLACLAHLCLLPQ
jgi:adenylyl-sulfate kinase